MRIYLLLGFFFQLITIPAYGMKNKEIKPLGIKNFPVSKLHLDGICAHIAKFQILNAGFNAINTETYNGQDNLFWTIAQKYKKQQKEQPDNSFMLTPIDIENVNDNKIGLFGHFSKTYPYYPFAEREHTIKDKNFTVGDKPEELDTFLKNKFNRHSLMDKKPLFIINIYYNNKPVAMIEELQDITIPTFQSTYGNYKLVGVVQQHNYTLRKSNLERNLDNLFVGKLPSGQFFIQKYNTLWGSHLDAYVNYNDTWYVMDDETRWKVSTEKNSDTAEALIHCYPGIPLSLIYVPTKVATKTTIDTRSKKHSLTLTRETKTPSRLKSALVLFAGALCDGLAIGLYAYSLARGTDYVLGEKPTTKNITISSIFGLITGCVSMAWHGRRMLSMHKSQITYTSQSPRTELGPRGK